MSLKHFFSFANVFRQNVGLKSQWNSNVQMFSPKYNTPIQYFIPDLIWLIRRCRSSCIYISTDGMNVMSCRNQRSCSLTLDQLKWKSVLDSESWRTAGTLWSKTVRRRRPDCRRPTRYQEENTMMFDIVIARVGRVTLMETSEVMETKLRETRGEREQELWWKTLRVYSELRPENSQDMFCRSRPQSHVFSWFWEHNQHTALQDETPLSGRNKEALRAAQGCAQWGKYKLITWVKVMGLGKCIPLQSHNIQL